MKDSKDSFKYDEKADPFEAKRDSMFLMLVAGNPVTVRFLTEFSDFVKAYRHDFVRVNKNGKILPGFGKPDKSVGERFAGSFTCLSSKKNLAEGVVCPLCEAGLRPAAKFAARIIDKTAGTAKFFEHKAVTIYRRLEEEFNNNGTICNIDFKLSREGKTKEDTRYSVSALTKTIGDLTKEDLKLAEDLSLSTLFAEKTREEILDSLAGKKKGREIIEKEILFPEQKEGEEEKVTPF